MTKSVLLLATLLTASVTFGQSYAPSTITGGILFATVSSGSGFYAPSGSFFMVSSIAGRAYTIYGGPGVDGTVGTYSYTKTGPTTAQLVLDDSSLGIQISQSIVFTSYSTGTYTISNAYGSQSGTFTFSIPQAGSQSDWTNEKNYPWVWSPSDGWLYYSPSDDGLMVYSVQTGQWHTKP